MFRQAPTTALVTVVNAALVTGLLALTQHDLRALVWLALIVGAAACRTATRQWFFRAKPSAEQAGFWAVVSIGNAVVSGLLWGGGAIWLMPPDEAARLFWAVLISGMCAGAAAMHASHLPTVLGFIIPAALPLAFRFAEAGSGRDLVASALMVIFVGAVSLSARQSSQQFGEVLHLQLDLAARSRELDAMNARLRAEIEEHRATEANLRQAQKMEAVGQLTGGIAHDFNNLLTAVRQSLDLLCKRLPDADPRALRLLDNAMSGIERGAALTGRLLAFGRRQALRPASIDVPDLVRGMSDLLRSSVGAKVRIETRFPIELPKARVDANQLELALLNLAVNARDAMPDGGDLVIAARQETVGAEHSLAPGTYVVLSVRDTGHGMDEPTLARAMEPFFTTKGVGRGTGLGLPMVCGLAAQSGGQLLLRSRRGEGTTAELWLPQAGGETSADEAAAQPSAAVPAEMRPLRVLLVDDDSLVRTSTAEVLQDMGHSVIEAGSGAEALALAERGAAFDLVITDYAMPGITGLQLAEALRRQRPDLPVLLATGYAELQDEVPGWVRHLPKPFGRKQLARAVLAALP